MSYDRFYKKVATHMGYQVSPNTDVVELVAQGLLQNQANHGAMYCPCLLAKTQDTICPCKAFREQPSGSCHCGLYHKR